MEDNYVSEAFKELSMQAVNDNLQREVSGSQEAGPSTRGHRNVCLLCGGSTLRRRSDRLKHENPTEIQQSIINIIESKIAPREISTSDHVCKACWLRTKREVIRMNRQNERRPKTDTAEEQEPGQMQPSDTDTLSQPEPASTEEKQVIVLPNYRRAANSSHSCVFPNCSRTTLHSISDPLRATILHIHRYYLPKLARVCSKHLKCNMWDTLYNSENSIDTFSIDQIQDAFSFGNVFSPR